MAYTGIGRDKLREMTNREDCPFILWNGSKRLIKRQAFDEYILKVYSIESGGAETVWKKGNVRFDVPIWHKLNLSIEEAAKYSGIGRAKLYEMTNREDCPFVLWVESRRLIKRKEFDEYISKVYSI